MNGKFLTALIIYMLTVCSGSQNTREMLRGIPQQDQAVEDYSETMVEYMSVDETITACTDIVMGKLLYVEYQNSLCCYHFSDMIIKVRVNTGQTPPTESLLIVRYLIPTRENPAEVFTP